MYFKNLRLLSVYKQMYHIRLYEHVLGNFEDKYFETLNVVAGHQILTVVLV